MYEHRLVDRCSRRSNNVMHWSDCLPSTRPLTAVCSYKTLKRRYRTNWVTSTRGAYMIPSWMASITWNTLTANSPCCVERIGTRVYTVGSITYGRIGSGRSWQSVYYEPSCSTGAARNYVVAAKFGLAAHRHQHLPPRQPHLAVHQAPWHRVAVAQVLPSQQRTRTGSCYLI